MPFDWKQNPLLVFVVFTAIHQRHFETFVFGGNVGGALQAHSCVGLKELQGICLVHEILSGFCRACHHLAVVHVVLPFLAGIL